MTVLASTPRYVCLVSMRAARSLLRKCPRSEAWEGTYMLQHLMLPSFAGTWHTVTRPPRWVENGTPSFSPSSKAPRRMKIALPPRPLAAKPSTLAPFSYGISGQLAMQVWGRRLLTARPL